MNNKSINPNKYKKLAKPTKPTLFEIIAGFFDWITGGADDGSDEEAEYINENFNKLRCKNVCGKKVWWIEK